VLRQIENLSSNVLGVRAEGQVTKADYDGVFIPLLNAAYRKGEPIRLLYQLGPEFTGYTAGAALDDFYVGIKYLRLFERCAIVTDAEWIGAAARFVASFLPCPTRVFANAQLSEAEKWLESPDSGSRLNCELRDDGLLVIRPRGALRREDFDKLSKTVDPWIEEHGQLRGLVVAMEKFPGWENFGSLLQHFEFVRDHQKKVRKVAVAADGTLPELVANIGGHFIDAKVKKFAFSQVEEAKNWAST